ncbi:MAG: nucleotidyltransferase family protein [Acidimicrobiales bacterium]|nr:nucleotidyltransferase family protein [Acidimicrobiales bacterium]
MAETVVRPLHELVERRRSGIKEAVARHRGLAVAVFGSVARGEERADSDLDFLVEFEPGSSLFDLVRLQEELQVLLGHPVDVVSLGGLLPRDEDVRRDAIWL